jgi:hypothetical protein
MTGPPNNAENPCASCPDKDKRIQKLEVELADSNHWRERHLADRDAYALRDERRFKYLRELHESGLIPLDVFVKFSRIHGVPDKAEGIICKESAG